MNGDSARSYEDIFDAINADLAASGVSRKEIAALLWPGRRLETAMGLFSRAMTPDNTDVHLSVEQLMAIIKRTGGEHTIHYLCDYASFERPARKSKESMREEMRAHMQQLMTQLREACKKFDFTVESDGGAA